MSQTLLVIVENASSKDWHLLCVVDSFLFGFAFCQKWILSLYNDFI